MRRWKLSISGGQNEPRDAIAGGNELALHCDLVVASPKARFGMSLAQVGLAPNWFLAKKLMEVKSPTELTCWTNWMEYFLNWDLLNIPVGEKASQIFS